MENFRYIFSKMGHHLITVPVCGDGWISSFWVAGLVIVVLWSSL
jgi:hypothetical protein